MKQYILIIILLHSFVSCGKHSKHCGTPVQVESFMEERPDSALNVLQGIDLENDDYGQMLKYYAQGRVQFENEDYPASIISFFNAEKIAKEQNNHYILGLIYYSVSGIYRNVYNYIEQQNYAQLAYDQFILSGNEDYIFLGLETLAEAHYNNKDYNQGIILSQELLEKAELNNNARLKNSGLRLLSRSYIKAAKYRDAKNVIVELKNHTKNLTPQDYRNLCLAYIKMGELDSANVYRRFAQTDEQKSLWVVIKEPETGKPVANIFDLEEPIFSVDTTTRKIINQNLAQTVASYHAYEQNLQEAELHGEKMSKIVIVTVALLLLVFSFLWYRFHLKAHRREMEIKMMEAENIRHILKVTEDGATAMQQSVNQLFEQKFKSIDELCNTYYVYQGSNNERTKIYIQQCDRHNFQSQ